MMLVEDGGGAGNHGGRDTMLLSWQTGVGRLLAEWRHVVEDDVDTMEGGDSGGGGSVLAGGRCLTGVAGMVAQLFFDLEGVAVSSCLWLMTAWRRPVLI